MLETAQNRDINKYTPAVGDLVFLKSGGPTMTAVAILAAAGWITCHWFDKDGHLCKGDFPAAALLPYGSWISTA